MNSDAVFSHSLWMVLRNKLRVSHMLGKYSTIACTLSSLLKNLLKLCVYLFMPVCRFVYVCSCLYRPDALDPQNWSYGRL